MAIEIIVPEEQQTVPFLDKTIQISLDVKYQDHPVRRYLAKLQSERSKRVMANALRVVISVIRQVDIRQVEYADLFDFKWHKLTDTETNVIWERLQQEYDYKTKKGIEKRKYSPSSINRILSALRRVLYFCWKVDGIEMTHEQMRRAADIDNIKGETVPAGRDLAQGEIYSLYAVCSIDNNLPGGIRDSAIIAVLHNCGLRRSEIASLELQDIDFEIGKLQVRRGKGNKDREVGLSDGVIEALSVWINIRGDSPGGLFLPVRKGGKIVYSQTGGKVKSITAQTVYDMLKRRASQAGIKDFSPHDFRRTFIGDELDNGTDMVTVSSDVGHSSVNTTAKYDRRGFRSQLEAAKKRKTPYVPHKSLETGGNTDD